MYCFTEHARERWEERIGGALPSNLEIERIIGESIILQKFRQTYTPRGMPLKILSLYWHIRRGIVMKMDEKHGKVVTVLGSKEADHGETNEGGMTYEDKVIVAEELKRSVAVLEKRENYPVIKEQVDRLRKTIVELER